MMRKESKQEECRNGFIPLDGGYSRAEVDSFAAFFNKAIEIYSIIYSITL
jgi:hypothetical protein